MRVLRNVQPTAEQLPILGDVGPGFRLIRGAAGSGKTTAALMRLRQLCAARVARKRRHGTSEPVRVLVLTFNRTLRGYIQHLASEQVNQGDVALTVETFSRWAKGLCPNPNDVNVVDQRLVLDLLDGAGFSDHQRYFAGEVDYLLGRYPRERRQEYLDAVRTGRGRTPAVGRSVRVKLLEEFVAPYEAEKARLGQLDWNDVALEATVATNQRFDVAVVDEAQDLSANQLRCVMAHLSDDHTTTFILDAVQRIYPQAFLWREVGIQMRANQVFTLKRNHRNTAAIARLAASLVQGLPLEEDGVVPNADACEREGHKPQLLVGPYSAQIRSMLDTVTPYIQAEESVAILQPRGGGWFNFTRKELAARGLPYCELTRERDWPTGHEQVALSTIHSAKGLEFDHVLLPGLNQEVTPHGSDDGDGTLESLQRLVAMGIGRARKTVTLGYKPEDRSTLIDLLDPATYELVEVS